MQDNQLQYLIQLCRAKNIPEEEITKILSENSKSEFIKGLETSFLESQVYLNTPQKWKQYSKKYVEYVGTLMDPSKIYTTVKDEPSMPNPQVKKKEELKFKKELLNYVLIMKNRALKKYLSDSLIDSKDNTPKSIAKSFSVEKLKSKTLKEELESWDFKDEEFSSKGPVSVVSPVNFLSGNTRVELEVSPFQSAEVDQSAQTAQSGQSAEVGQSAQSAQSAELAQSAQTAQSAQSAEVGQSAQKAQTAQSSESESEQREESSMTGPVKKIKLENNIQEQVKEGEDLQSLREKVLMSRKNVKKDENKASKKDNDETSLEEGEISSDGEALKEEFSRGNGNGKRGKKYENNNKHRKGDWRERHQSGSPSGAVEKYRAVAPANQGMSSYLTYPASGNVHQSNHYIGAMPYFRPPVFAMGYSQQYQPPNPYMQIDSNALAKAQMLANMSQQQTQPIFPQMSGTRAGGPAMNHPMQYTNSNQTNYWMMNMPHINNGPGFAFAPGNVPQNGSFNSYAGRPSDAHLDAKYMYENPTS